MTIKHSVSLISLFLHFMTGFSDFISCHNHLKRKLSVVFLFNYITKKFKYNALILVFLPQNLDSPQTKRLHDEVIKLKRC